jgi:hypothetical protein
MSVLWAPALDEEATHWVEAARELNETHFAPLAAEIDREQRYPWETIDILVSSGLTALAVPREFGGQGVALTTLVAVMQELSRGCASIGAIWGMTSLGSGSLLAAGNEQQKAFYTKEIMAGRNVSFALTERGAGSDPSAIRSTGTRVDGGWHLRGEKIFIGNGGASRHYVAFVRTGSGIYMWHGDLTPEPYRPYGPLGRPRFPKVAINATRVTRRTGLSRASSTHRPWPPWKPTAMPYFIVTQYLRLAGWPTGAVGVRILLTGMPSPPGAS